MEVVGGNKVLFWLEEIVAEKSRLVLIELKLCDRRFFARTQHVTKLVALT
jgi:hypothetical protein